MVNCLGPSFDFRGRHDGCGLCPLQQWLRYGRLTTKLLSTAAMADRSFVANCSNFFILMRRLFIIFMAYNLPDVPFLHAVGKHWLPVLSSADHCFLIRFRLIIVHWNNNIRHRRRAEWPDVFLVDCWGIVGANQQKNCRRWYFLFHMCVFLRGSVRNGLDYRQSVEPASQLSLWMWIINHYAYVQWVLYSWINILIIMSTHLESIVGATVLQDITNNKAKLYM